MTLKEYVKQKDPSSVDDVFSGGVRGCPHEYEGIRGFVPECHEFPEEVNCDTCSRCWNQEIGLFDNTTDNTTDNPDRYLGGKYECIKVMVDVFGEECVKHFCLLNAFKYIWRNDKKGGLNDIKKAKNYLDYYIDLSEGNFIS